MKNEALSGNPAGCVSKLDEIDFLAFYTEVSNILGVEAEYKPDLLPRYGIDRFGNQYHRSKKNGRWHGRDPGNGRFPGRGIVRHYGGFIHVALTSPRASGSFKTDEEVFTFLRKVMAPQI